MNINKAQCEAFRKNPSINPLTGREIQVGKVTHQKLVKACEEAGKRTSKSPPNRSAPPMGPMIHWEYDVQGVDDKRDNAVDFANYIRKRIKELKASTSVLSKFELVDMKNIIDGIKEHLDDEPTYIEKLDQMKEKLDELLKRDTVINDVPSYAVVAHLEVKPSRVFIRGRVLYCYRLWESAMSDMDASIETNTIFAHVGPAHMKNLIEQKHYVDYIIKHKIFSHEDIYKRTFKTDRPYEELKEKFAEYKVLFKKLDGKSP